ncbi:hypothetical protein ACFSYG_12035 [Leeuwenhoekiella polynyae]|uniref:Uncharacterized protein n=1 Tax=Leeuwenhoekiella polynyae TaxID=1550906 RepID=A0A4Q0PFK1_9FLAO|nr:hypothetical protein [Leeuwenhoekiella polynyae]RXG25675.1 hypothetical protein DSM02_842 [Leeuwenhoekiella polynyae]
MKNKNKNCKVDIVSVYLNHKDNSYYQPSFEEIITDEEINNQELNFKGKTISFSILENNDNFIIGFLTSSIDKDLPAKINKNTKEISSLDVAPEESLVFGSVLLYSKDMNALFYEVNRDTIYLDGFKHFIYECYNKSEMLKEITLFDLKFNTIFRKNEYERALKMDIYKGFRVRIHQPKKLLAEIKNLESSIDKKVESEFISDIENASALNSDSAEIFYDVKKPKTSGGLTKDHVESMIKNLRSILKYGQIRDKVDIVEVKGYTVAESRSITPIDLIGDVYSSKFKLDVPRLNKNVQKKERRKKIIEVYNKEKPILKDFI